MTTDAMEGGCLCGAIRYRLLARPFDADYCHCRQCQKATGAPVGTWMDFKTEQVQWLNETPKEFASSDAIRRGFCPQCGTSLSYRHTDYPQYLTLSIPTLDAPQAVAPNYHIHTASQLPWLELSDPCPRYPGDRSDRSDPQE
ncbi:GFA family protein [Ferrimonas balearica]|uniref:GFA family protein n=1 Tax=Ferrimonas balearica TaxID=44012 RepID=UPI001C998E13|nr:GFA family protein [Ferrimonas balearica]MBY5991330.1 GFA family protein [Ferrimonas balearica]